MTARRKTFNPFYPLVVLVGVAFTVTACAYGWMVYISRQHDPQAIAAAQDSKMLPWLREHGETLLMGEVVGLVVVSVAAMATDRYWSGRETPNE
jgi:hypothetical protein